MHLATRPTTLVWSTSAVHLSENEGEGGGTVNVVCQGLVLHRAPAPAYLAHQLRHARRQEGGAQHQQLGQEAGARFRSSLQQKTNGWECKLGYNRRHTARSPKAAVESMGRPRHKPAVRRCVVQTSDPVGIAGADHKFRSH